MSKRSLAAAVAALLAPCLILGGCHYDYGAVPQPSASPSPEAPAGGITATPAPVAEAFALPADAGGWDPYVGSKSGNMILLGLVCESLYTLDNTFTAQPLLAQSGQVSEDGLTWTVTLRSGVRFSNGEALTAQRVVQAVNAAKGEKSLYASRLAGVARVRARDDNTVVFELTGPNAGFLSLLDFPIALVSGDEVLGTGPYVVGEDALVANPHWWRDLSLPRQSIPLKEVASAETLVADFSAGTVSLASLDPTGPDALSYAGSFQSWEYPTSTVVYLGFRCDRGVTKSAQFRRAASLALDRGVLVNALSDHGWAATLPVHPSNPRYDQTLAGTLDLDLQEANQLLDELGYTVGDDGARYQGRQTLKLTLLVSAGNAYKERLAQAVANQLANVGIAVEIKSLAWEEYKKALANGEFDIYLAEYRMTGDLDPGGLVTAGSGLSYGAVVSEDLTAALAEARRTGDWGAFDSLWAQELPQAVLCFKTATMLTRWGQVTGASPTQGNLFDQFASWQIA